MTCFQPIAQPLHPGVSGLIGMIVMHLVLKMVKPVLSREERGFAGKERIALYHVKIYQAMQRKRGNVYQGQVLVLKM